MHLQSSPHHNSGTAADSNQRIIKIEETSAYQRSKNRHAVEPKIKGDGSSIKMHEVLAKTIGVHRIGSRDQFQHHRFDIDHLNTGNFDLVKIKWQGAFELAQDPLAARYVISLVLAGSLTQRMNQHQTFCCVPNTATIFNPGETVESIASEAGEVLLISIDRDLIDSALNKLLDRTFKQPLIFLTGIDLTSELGLSLKNFGQFLWEAATKNDSEATTGEVTQTERRADFSPLVLQKLEQAFLGCLIEGLPSNYSEEILYQTDGAFARHVRKARAFIEAHLHEDIKLGDIATATGVCSRLLQKAFSYHCGCSPMRFVTLARLQRIRQELIQATANTKIVDVMMHYGFTQGGKFVKEYQQLFGEKPSETLKRCSQIQQSESPLWLNLDDTIA
jgi:AraC-like DNA-binding protein